MSERRYSCYKRADVWVQLVSLQSQLHIEVIPNSVIGSALMIRRRDTSEAHNAVVLARSSDWYHYSLNTFDHSMTAIIAGTHDSCVPIPVLALDAMRWYDPLKMRSDWGALEPKLDASGRPIPDTFDQHRRSHYGHNMLIGALMMRRSDALARLATFRKTTRLRIEAEVRHLHRRRPGHPIAV
jgi:hypothetical protein